MPNIFFMIYTLMPISTLGSVFGPNNIIPFPQAHTTATTNTQQNKPTLTAAHFPSTFKDVSFSDQVAIKTQGYEPFKNMSAYDDLIVAGEEFYIERDIARMEQQSIEDAQTMSDEEYCDNYPLDETRCSPTSETLTQVIEIGNRQDSPPPTQITDITSSDDTGQNVINIAHITNTIGGGPVVARNDTYGGSCYPAAISNHFKNKVLTTGQYEQQLPPFEKALITVFRKEGKCGKIENDRCGWTCFGISQCNGLTEQQVKRLTRADAEKIYYNKYWKAYGIDKLPDVISGDVFLAGMGSGPATAVRQFRRFLKLKDGNRVDDSVVNAVKNYNGDIHNDWLDVRQAFLVKVAKEKYHNKVLKGWMNGIKLKRENGCHVVPEKPLYR